MYPKGARKKLMMDVVALLFAVVSTRLMPKRMHVCTGTLWHGGLGRRARLL